MDNQDSQIKTPSEEPDHPTLTQKVMTRLVYFALLLIAIATAVFLFWSFQDEKIIEAKNQPFPVRSVESNPTPNGVVILNVDFCKYYDVDGDLRMSFINTTHEVFLPITRERGLAGCRQTEVPVLIPKDIEPGRYRVKFYVTYDLNPIKQNILNIFESSEFEIVRKM